MLLLLRMIFYL